MRPWCAAALVFMAWSVRHSPARAEASAADVALAETLFQEAQKLMKEQRYAEACPKFEESQRLDPGGGTLFQLASCHAFTGRLASAWAEFSEVALLAKQRNRFDIEHAAREQVRLLEPRLSWLVIDVPVGARRSGLFIRRDGTVLGAASYGTPMPADPGTHTVSAEAHGFRSWSTSVVIGAVADRKRVVVPELVELPEPERPAQAARQGLPAPARDSQRHAPALIYAAAGVGVLGLGTAVYFGVRSYTREQTASEKCPDAECSDPSAVEASKSAVTSANVANVAGAFGLVGAGVFTYLLLTNRGSDAGSARVRVEPRLAPGVLALGVQGRL
jgi:hypothetical protein